MYKAIIEQISDNEIQKDPSKPAIHQLLDMSISL